MRAVSYCNIYSNHYDKHIKYKLLFTTINQNRQ